VRAAKGSSRLPVSAPNSGREWRCNALRAGVVTGALLIGLASGCGAGNPAPELPPGNWIYGDAPTISALLASLESLQGTPTARFADPLRAPLDGCRDFIARSPEADPWALQDSVRCASPGEVPESIVELRGEGDLAFVLDLAPGRRLNGRLTRAQTGAIAIVASLDPPEASNLGALLVPAKEPVGTISLAAADTLVHARLRPASGLNIARLISQDSQADHMFRLRSELFLGQVLDGTWEFAIYMPRAEHATPPMALALDYALRAPAKAAITKLVSELEATWPIHHSKQVIAGYEGACFHDLRLLPDLVPCWVLTEQSIVIGWNPLSLAVALAGSVKKPDSLAGPFGASGGLVVHLDRLPKADRLLQRQLGGSETGERIDYVWDELRLEGSNDGERLQLELSLEMGGAS